MKILQQNNVGSKNLTRGWNKTIVAPILWKPYNKTILAPIVQKPYDKTILASSITFPSQSDRSPVYLEDGNLPLAPPREYILVITSPWLTRPQEKKRQGELKKILPSKKFLAINLWCNIVGLAITPNTTWETTNSKLLWENRTCLSHPIYDLQGALGRVPGCHKGSWKGAWVCHGVLKVPNDVFSVSLKANWSLRISTKGAL